MRFREGMLGITVVMVAISMGLLGGWALSTDVVESEKTVYNELTEITPLFGSENAPQFTPYNPSSNYTGYYTDDSTVGSTHYFDGVDYERSARANTYRLNLMYTSHDAATQNLTGITSDSTFSLEVAYWPGNNDYNRIQNVSKIALSQLIEDLDLDTYSKILLNNANPDYSTTQSFVTFAVSSDMIGSGSREFFLKDPSLTGDLRYGSGPIYINVAASDTPNVTFAAEIDLATGLVTLYEDNDATTAVGTFDASMVYLIWGGSSSTFKLGDSVVYDAYQFPAPAYMDPSKGVELS